MIITWDEPKRAQNLAKHGLDFADFETLLDLATALIVSAKNDRIKLIAAWGGVILVTVITAPLGNEAISIISLRRASVRERQQYEQAFP